MINKIFSNAQELYVNLHVLSEVITCNLQKSNHIDISTLEFNYIFDLSDKSIKISNNMDLENFCLFCKCSELNIIRNNLLNFISSLYTIKHSSSDLKIVSLKSKIDNIPINENSHLRNTIITELTKLHKNVTEQAIYFEKIMADICIYMKGIKAWDKIKQELEDTVSLFINDTYNKKII